MFRPDGRTALITGGGGGLRSAVANLLTEAGARVVVAGRSRVAGTHPSVAFDVSNEAPRRARTSAFSGCYRSRRVECGQACTARALAPLAGCRGRHRR